MKSTLLLSLLLASVAGGSAFAAGPNFDGKVSALGLNRVELAAQKGVPAWVEKGKTIQAFGWDAVIHEVRGEVVTLQLSPNKLAKVKVGDAVSIRAPASEEPAMCGT